MTPDEKATLEMLIARNAEAVNEERRKLRKSVTNLLALNLLSIDQIAASLDTTVDFVKAVQQQLYFK
ncbi:hypothetical protein [Spirosoma sp.]|uniref:hypothetical protein n=1 Tax=Spirosoma sp. TaxID=1899569 RepID=UPI0026247B0B|nr:hypothetical protein [Spirosoma sp.]MCX6213387.1 hypothetical protein [Spirosoma sp.]